jgi:hypothetical protein
LKKRLLDAPQALRRRYVRGLVSNIIVDREKAVISGPPAAIAAAVTSGTFKDEVRSSIRDWRTRQDSNCKPGTQSAVVDTVLTRRTETYG